mmetsp:Transcript_92011/g.284524  ORF Transcript_92011/g.284524 Transcript_92011/m.284524 type:complete len:209 (-) Transcript_92011:7-633(-)
MTAKTRSAEEARTTTEMPCGVGAGSSAPLWRAMRVRSERLQLSVFPLSRSGSVARVAPSLQSANQEAIGATSLFSREVRRAALASTSQADCSLARALSNSCPSPAATAAGATATPPAAAPLVFALFPFFLGGSAAGSTAETSNAAASSARAPALRFFLRLPLAAPPSAPTEESNVSQLPSRSRSSRPPAKLKGMARGERRCFVSQRKP